jgi:hypothetical protein
MVHDRIAAGETTGSHQVSCRCRYPGREGGRLSLPEDGGDTFLRNSGTTQRTTRRHIPEEDTLQNRRCDNLKSYTIINLQVP